MYEEQLKYNQVYLIDLNSDDKDSRKLDVEGHAVQIAFNRNGKGMVAKVSPTPLIDDIYMLPKIV